MTDERLLLALDDYINPKTAIKKIFGCEKIFDHAAKQNQSKYPWAQNIVAVGLLKTPKSSRDDGLSAAELSVLSSKKERREMNRDGNRPKIAFETKLAQANAMLTDIAEEFRQTRITLVTDSWFGNNGLWMPLHDRLGIWIDMLSRLRFQQ